ncbi:hypothetical protein ACX80N_12020 [Arthrobacter sp. MDT2-16]
MKRSAWAITAVLVGLAVAAGWFFGLDSRHAVALVGAALAAGVANGLLEAVDVRRVALPPLPDPVLGIADLQSLEFSLASTDPGARAVLEVHALAEMVAAARPHAPRSDALVAFAARSRPLAPTSRELRSLVDELERLVRPAPAAGSPAARPAMDPSAAPTAHHQEIP